MVRMLDLFLCLSLVVVAGVAHADGGGGGDDERGTCGNGSFNKLVKQYDGGCKQREIR
jgi:hypothetical protein